MSRRQTLTLIELTVMLLIFALAAALCMYAFARTETQSRETACRDQAMIRLQSTAEVLRSCRGDYSAAAAGHGGTWDGTLWTLDCGDYQIRVQPEDPRQPYLGGARLEAVYQGIILISMNVRWQEVDP